MTNVAVSADERWPVRSFDPWNGKLHRGNLWDLYRAMRDDSPAIKSDTYDRLWLLPRYADVKAAALDHKTFSSASGTMIGHNRPAEPPGVPIEYDPPEQNKFRAPMIAPFIPRRVGQFERLVQDHVGRIFGGFTSGDIIDVVTDIAEATAVSVISDIIGFDDEGRRRNREISLAVVNASYSGHAAANTRYVEFIRQQVHLGTSNPTHGFLSDMARHIGRAPDLTEDDVVAMVHSLGLAGHHTTINGISSMVVYASDISLRRTWLTAPTLDSIGAFIEEVLRIDPPIHLQGRWTTRPVTIGDTYIPAESQVALLYASANHDERQFPEPEQFDPTRPAGHLAFGHGVHTCLGMALARLEMSVILREMLERFPNFRAVDEPIDAGMIFGHHVGWNAVPVQLLS